MVIEREGGIDSFVGSSYATIVQECLGMWSRFRQCSDNVVEMQSREEGYLIKVVAQLSDDLQKLEDDPTYEVGRRISATHGDMNPMQPSQVFSEPVLNRESVPLEGTRGGQHSANLEALPISPCGAQFDTLDTPGITETMSEDQILTGLRVIVGDCKDQLQPDSYLRWVRVRNGSSQPVLECPFININCDTLCSELEVWFRHTMTHFQIATPFVKTILPPSSNTCCICEKRFTSSKAIDSWQQLLAHYAFHYLHAHTLTNVEPDSTFLEYLKVNELIDRPTSKRCKGKSEEQIQSADKLATSTALDTALNPGGTIYV